MSNITYYLFICYELYINRAYTGKQTKLREFAKRPSWRRIHQLKGTKNRLMRWWGESTEAEDTNSYTTVELDNKLEVASIFIAVDNVEIVDKSDDPTAILFKNLVLGE